VTLPTPNLRRSVVSLLLVSLLLVVARDIAHAKLEEVKETYCKAKETYCKAKETHVTLRTPNLRRSVPHVYV